MLSCAAKLSQYSHCSRPILEYQTCLIIFLFVSLCFSCAANERILFIGIGPDYIVFTIGLGFRVWFSARPRFPYGACDRMPAAPSNFILKHKSLLVCDIQRIALPGIRSPGLKLSIGSESQPALFYPGWNFSPIVSVPRNWRNAMLADMKYLCQFVKVYTVYKGLWNKDGWCWNGEK